MGRTKQTEPALVEFGARVRARRLELGWSQERLAQEVGLHMTYVSSVERGERNISLRNIVRLAGALSVDTGALTKGLT
ncbi:MAG: helix-turn-helix transcriptional regulator [Ilumatobacteraceae bacterium]